MIRRLVFLFCWVGLGAGLGFSCSPNSSTPCERSEGCKRSGLCAYNNGRCVAEQASHCRQSRQCRTLGMCSLQHNKCVVLRDQDCRHSEVCQQSGFCIVRTGECVALTATYCKNQDSCRKEGLCSYNQNLFLCVAELPEDCQQSEACKQGGRCTPQYGRCIRVPEPEAGVLESSPEARREGEVGASSEESLVEADAGVGAEERPEVLEPVEENNSSPRGLFQRCSKDHACSSGLACVQGFCWNTCTVLSSSSTECEKEQICRELDRIKICRDRCDLHTGSQVIGGCPRWMFCDTKQEVFVKKPRYLCSPLPVQESGNRTKGESCDSVDACQGTKNLFCDANKCVQACDPHLGERGNSGCPSSQSCVEDVTNFLGGRCVSPSGQKAGERCSSTTLPCEKGLLCIKVGTDSLCASTCNSILDCISGFTCDTLPEGKVCRAPRRRQRGEVCSANLGNTTAPCRSGLSCVPFGSSSICHQRCNPSQSNCGAAICQTLPRTPSLSVCLTQGTIREGDFCDHLSKHCVPGLVCVDYYGFSLCTRECDLSPTFQCPQNHICLEGPRPKGAPKHNNFCAKKVAFGDNCTGLKFCAGFCLELNANSVCTKECDVSKPGECPSGWVCAPAPTLKSGVCMRAVRKLGQTCDAQNGCVQGTHCIILAGKASGVCLQACGAGTSGCPSQQECKILVRQSGVCVEKTRNLYETCSSYQLQSVFTDCKGSLLCVGETSRCHAFCSPGVVDCPQGFSCVLNVCLQDCKANNDCTQYPGVCTPVSSSTQVCIH